MDITWIVVADATRGRILAASGRSDPLTNVEQMIHGESRLRDTERISDRPGRAFDSFGGGRHAMETQTDPAEQDAIRFAAEIARRIEQGRTNGDFDNLVLVAPPRFLGHLRKSLSGGAAKCVKAEIHKEFTLLDDEDIRMRLADYL